MKMRVFVRGWKIYSQLGDHGVLQLRNGPEESILLARVEILKGVGKIEMENLNIIIIF